MKKKDTINIVLGADERYFPGLLVTIATTLLNTDSLQAINISIFDGGISTTSKHLLHTIATKINSNISITWLKPNLEKYSLLPSMSGNYMAYARLLIPEILNEDKAIWFDADLLVFKDIELLWNISLNDKTIAAACEPYDNAFSNDIKNLSDFNIPAGSDYFNSGVLLMNLKKLREEQFTDKSLEFLYSNNGNYLWHDQSAINVVLYEKILKLDQSWNFFNTLFYDNLNIDFVYRNDYIYHFLQRPKPWQKYSGDPHAQFFYSLMKIANYSMPELHGFKNTIEKIKWLSPQATYWYFRLRAIIFNKIKDESLLNLWIKNIELLKKFNKNKLFQEKLAIHLAKAKKSF